MFQWYHLLIQIDHNLVGMSSRTRKVSLILTAYIFCTFRFGSFFFSRQCYSTLGKKVEPNYISQTKYSVEGEHGDQAETIIVSHNIPRENNSRTTNQIFYSPGLTAH